MDMLDQILEKLARSPQDKDIEDRKGTQPKKYYAKDAEGDDMAKSTKQARARHFEKGTKKDDNDPSAYEPAPGDKSAKTKPSQHTKKFKKMFGENYDGDMAQRALENIIRNANNLKRVVKEDGDYPAWWNSKLTKADDYLDVCHDYLMSELSQSEQTIIGEDAVATAKLKAKQADEMERLKQKHEDELEALKGRHDRESERQKGSDETERENEKIRKQRETERAKNEEVSEDYKKVIKMYPRDNDWKKLITKHKKAIDDFRNKNKDLPKKVEDELIDWASQTGAVGRKDDVEDFIMDILDEGKLVTTVDQVLGAIVKKLKSEMGKKYKQNAKDGLAYINNIAKMVGMKATDQKQSKGKLFLKLGEDLEEGLWDNIRKKRARGEKMRKKGEKGAPTQDQIKRAQGEEVEEDRDYKKEYANYHSQPEQVKRRAKRNEARRSLKNNKDIKGKDVHHKDNNPMNNDKSNLSIVSQNYNRKEPRLREVLDKNASQQDYIDDFLKSDAPQFKGKSKEKIIKMALAAYREKQDGGK
tara:strand:+ start:63 stop:1649 length:1587 start_codon:yes stop_codon:yes gene_type:complete